MLGIKGSIFSKGNLSIKSHFFHLTMSKPLWTRQKDLSSLFPHMTVMGENGYQKGLGTSYLIVEMISY